MSLTSNDTQRKARRVLLAQMLTTAAAVGTAVLAVGGGTLALARLGPLVMGTAITLVAGCLLTGWLLRPLLSWDRRLALLDRDQLDPLTLAKASGSSAAERGWNRLVEQGCRWQTLVELEQALAERLDQRGPGDAEQLLDGISDGVAAVDAAGNITFANTVLVGMCGVESATSLVGTALVQALRLDAAAQAQLQAAAPRSQIVVEWTVAEPGGQSRVRRAVRRCLEHGERSRYDQVWTVRDVTQQRLAESMREQFLSAATHEFRTPLANIRAYAESLDLGHDSDAEARKRFYNVIQSESIRLSQLVDDLLDISRMQAGSMSLDTRETDLGRLVDDATAKVQAQMREKSLTFRCELPPKYPKIVVDKSKLTAALVNLLGNAAKYTPAGGKVTFRVEVNAQQVQFAVTDTGIGIEPEELPRVFDRFFRSSDERVRGISGSGLGLALALEIARLHGGELTVESTLNKGSVFRLTIPLDLPN